MSLCGSAGTIPRSSSSRCPATRKIRNLRHNPWVALTLDSAAGGQDIVLAEGRARVGAAGADEQLAPLFARKYAALLGSESGLDQWQSTFFNAGTGHGVQDRGLDTAGRPAPIPLRSVRGTFPAIR